MMWKKFTGMDKISGALFCHQEMGMFPCSDFHVKAVIRKTGKDVFVYDVLPASEEPVMAGIAIDIGTTSVSAIIIDMLNGAVLAKGSAGNGQIRYGADVINRIIESENLVEERSFRMRSSKKL